MPQEKGVAITTSADMSRVWFVTGASSGLGHALCEAVLERGERVIATARHRERVAGFEDRHRERAVAVALDVTQRDHADAAVQAAVSAFRRIDVVVNNAGYGLFGALEELSDTQLRNEFETNFFGSLNVIRSALPVLRRQRSGHVVQISSLDGIAPAVAGETAYAATKFATEGLCEALAREVGHLGLRVTIVEPGPIRTDFAEAAVTKRVEIDDYAPSVGEALGWFETELAGKQPNDPARVAESIIDAVEADVPPLRLVLGEEAVAAVREKLDRQRRDLDNWAHLSARTAIPAS